MEKNFTPQFYEKKESEPKLLFKLILMRHQKTSYTEEGLDLTPEGEEGAREDGKRLKEEQFISNENPIATFHSPRARAKGTLKIAAQEADISTENSRPLKVLTSAKILDEVAFDEYVEGVLGDNPERIAQAYREDDFFNNCSEIIEPHSKRKERLYRAMEYLIRNVQKNNHNSDANVPQILAVSHFEIMTHIIDDVFGVENTGYRSPLPGEQVKIAAFEMEDRDKILLEVSFRDLEKKVVFNRKSRSIE